MSTRPKRGRIRTNDPEEMRRRVIDVAAVRFQGHGYNATSMQEILADAGVTGGALYHHFPTKKELALAVIRDRVGPEVRETWIKPVEKAASAFDGVKRAFGGVARALDRQGYVQGCPLNNLAVELSAADEDFRREIQLIYKEWHQSLAAKLRSDQAERRIREVDADALATLVMSSYSGAITMAKADQTSRPLRTTAKQLLLTLGALVR
jgi:AcrR family transcriptional regulator